MDWHHRRYSTPPQGGQVQPAKRAAGAPSAGAWRPALLKTCALRGEGIEELLSAAETHWQYQRDSGLNIRRERERVADGLSRILRSTLLERLLEQIPAADVEATVQQVVTRQLDPYSAAEALISRVSLSL